MGAAECDDGDTGNQQDGVPADRSRFTFQPGHQIGDGDINETRCGDGDDDRNPVARAIERVVTGQSAEDCGQAGNEVPEHRSRAFPAGGKEYGKVTGFLRDFVGDDGQRRAPAERWVGQKGGGDEQAVGEIVKAVADQDGEGSFVCRVVMAVRMVFALMFSGMRIAFARLVMSVTPQGDFFQSEETQDPAEQDGKRLVRRQSLLQCLGKQMQQGHGQEQSGRETDGQGDPLARQAEHDQRGSADAERSAKQAGADYLGEERRWHVGRVVAGSAPFKHSEFSNATALHLRTVVFCKELSLRCLEANAVVIYSWEIR